MAEKPHDAVVKLDTYRNLQRHRAVLPAIATAFLSTWLRLLKESFELYRVVEFRLLESSSSKLDWRINSMILKPRWKPTSFAGNATH